jgi:sugar-specific transcriptional regulator TrmB
MKNYNKIITIIFTVIFITVFSIFNFEEYKDFHQKKIELKENKANVEEKINNFKLEDIKELKDIQFYYTPYTDLNKKIIDLINTSKKEIYLEAYMLTEKKIQEALIRAFKR